MVNFTTTLRSKIFLSIDLDFWLTPEPALKSIADVMKYAAEHNIPLNVMMNHQQMLPHVNHSAARTLVNLDQHSDARDVRVDRFDCGSWISYVNWRKDGQFVWAKNNPDMARGNCNWKFNAPWNQNIGWGLTRADILDQKFNIHDLLKDAFGIGICLSPAYTYKQVYDAVRPILKGLPYQPGWTRENERYKAMKPPKIKTKTISDSFHKLCQEIV